MISERELLAKSQRYIAGYLTSATFVQFVSLFEDFIMGVLRLWLLAYIQKLDHKQVSMSVVRLASDLDAVKQIAVNRELNELSYKRLREWFTYLDGLTKLGCPSDDEIDQLAEIKATRDVLVHNRGVASPMYADKAGDKKRAEAGQPLELTASYHLASWQLIRKVVTDISTAAIAKASS